MGFLTTLKELKPFHYFLNIMQRPLKNRIVFPAIFFFLLLILSSCFKYRDVNVVGVTDVKLQNVSLEKVDVLITLQVQNPNNYKISIVDGDMQVYVKGVKLGNAVIKNNVVLPKKSDMKHDILISGTPSQMSIAAIPTLMGLMGKNKSVPIKIKGEIKARAKGISKKFPVDFSDNVSMGELK
jgi:LEA14-like dessication related protein